MNGGLQTEAAAAAAGGSATSREQGGECSWVGVGGRQASATAKFLSNSLKGFSR